MTQEEIREGNTLISIFMELTPCNSPYNGAFMTLISRYSDCREVVQFKTFITNELVSEQWYFYPKFDTSWDWLMPVYQRIVRDELYEESEEGIILFICLSDSLLDGDDVIEVFEHTVEFVKWFNKQNKIE